MYETPQVANPSIMLGEAVDALVKCEVNRLMRPIAEDYGCVFAAVGKPNPRIGHAAKLLLQDSNGNSFQVDSVIATRRLQPLILIDSKYVRDNKYNRDKGDGICTAHYNLRRTYPTIRQSIAVLAGSWSASSKAMMRSFDATLFEVGFSIIVSALAKYGIAFDWSEKEQDRAMEAWLKWERLSNEEYDAIAHTLLKHIDPQLRDTLCKTLDASVLDRPTEA